MKKSKLLNTVVEVFISRVPSDSDGLFFINGEAMEPVYHDGQGVFYADTDSLQPGDVGIIIYKGEVLIRLFLGNRYVTYQPIREDIYIQPDDDIEIVGRIVGALERNAVDEDFAQMNPLAMKYYG